MRHYVTAYNFSELIEAHAVDTYAQFAEQNKAALRLLPAPRIAKVLIGHNWPRRALRHVSPNLRSRVESVLPWVAQALLLALTHSMR